MSYERLTRLSVVSVEAELAREIKLEDEVKNFAKTRKVNYL